MTATAKVAAGQEYAQAPAAATAAAAGAGGSPAPKRQKCGFYVERKQRNCRFDVTPGSSFCGYHQYQGEGTGLKRVPCPYDPAGSHTVVEGDLERHRHRCPDYQLLLREQAKAYYLEGVNEGPAEEEVALPPASPRLADARGRVDSLAARRLAAAVALGQGPFSALLARVAAAHGQACSQEEPLSVAAALAAEPRWAGGGPERPVSAKHAVQQASIVGNMAAAGLLAGAAGTTYIEFGAGKGYLSASLADCCDATSLVMVDVRGFRLKADRSMRHLAMQRLRCDIKDFLPSGVPGLAGAAAADGGAARVAAPWVATGKHLCGAATDFTLRACCAQPGARDAAPQQPGRAGAAAGAAEGPAPGLRGVAVATCCHHRCSWRHYVGKDYFLHLGFSPLEFELISWMTGWALCGHEAPAGARAEGKEEEETAGSGSDSETDRQRAGGREGDAAAVKGEAAAAAAAATPGPGQGEGGWRPYQGLPRKLRIGVGQQCKRLIDAGRVDWLRRRRFAAEAVRYVEATVSGENRLLLATAEQAPA